MVSALDETCLAQHGEQSLLIGVFADRFGEITITLRVVCEPFSEYRQNFERVGVVERTQGRDRRLRKLEDQQLTARLQYAPHRAQCSRLVGDIAQSETDRDAIEGVVGEGQTFGIGLNVFDALREAGHARREPAAN